MAFFTVIPALLVGCGNDSPVAKIIVTDQKMPLIEWPDSSYVASLDSILALEPIKKTAETDAKINMNVFDAPLFKLPLPSIVPLPVMVNPSRPFTLIKASK